MAAAGGPSYPRIHVGDTSRIEIRDPEHRGVHGAAAYGLDVFDFEIRPPDMVKLRALNQHYSSMGSLPYV